MHEAWKTHEETTTYSIKLKTYIIILSGVKLDKDMTNLLQKGLNFSLSPRRIPTKI